MFLKKISRTFFQLTIQYWKLFFLAFVVLESKGNLVLISLQSSQGRWKQCSWASVKCFLVKLQVLQLYLLILLLSPFLFYRRMFYRVFFFCLWSLLYGLFLTIQILLLSKAWVNLLDFTLWKTVYLEYFKERKETFASISHIRTHMWNTAKTPLLNFYSSSELAVSFPLHMFCFLDWYLMSWMEGKYVLWEGLSW